jgi:hypothetical protein
VAALSDPARLALYKLALSDWQCTGRILFKPAAWNWIRKELRRNRTKKNISMILWNYVRSGGKIDEVVETRKLEVDDHLIRDYHYDLYVEIDGRMVYFETVLIDDDPTDPEIWVVSVHDP